MSEFNTFARSASLALLIAGASVGMPDPMANRHSIAQQIELPPPPQIEPIESALNRSGVTNTRSPQEIPAPPSSSPRDVVAVPAPQPKSSDVVVIPPPPPNPEYCYVGTWEVKDLSQYWLPLVQKFAQTKVSSKKTQGRAQITFTRDGYSIFEARDFQQKYKPKSAPANNKFSELELTLRGRATADYTEKKGMKLSFTTPNYRWFSSQLNLGEDLSVTGDKIFNLYGNGGKETISIPYDCLDRDTIVLKLPVPKSARSIALKLKRIY
jgi:hypothetical protein